MKLKRKRLLFAAVILTLTVFLPCCNNTDSIESQPVSSAPDAEEYAVYSTIINNQYIDEYTEYILIFRDINNYSLNRYPYILSDTIGAYYVEQDIMADFEKKNWNPSQLDYRFNIKTRYLLLSTAEDIELFRKGGNRAAGYWEEAQDRYPGMNEIIRVSRVGFNHDKTKAILYHSRHGGPGYAAAFFAILYKIDGSWIIKKQIWLWGS